MQRKVQRVAKIQSVIQQTLHKGKVYVEGLSCLPPLTCYAKLFLKAVVAIACNIRAETIAKESNTSWQGLQVYISSCSSNALFSGVWLVLETN